MNILETVFQYYAGNIQDPQPKGAVTLQSFIESQRNPKPGIRDIFHRIAQAEKEGDMKLKAELKQNNLFYFCPCVVVEDKRSYDSIRYFTGLLVLDFDHIDNAAEFRDIMFDRNKCIVVAYLSPSRRGVKFIVKIPVCKTVDQFKEYFYGIAYYMERFPGFDGTAQNPVLPLFLSWDPNLRYREDPKTWKIKGEKIDEFEAFEGDYEVLEEVSDEEKRRVLNIVKVTLERAEKENNGHKNVVAAALVLGGYVAKGYLDLDEAENYICQMISEIPYFSKNIKGYCKTAREMLQKGLSAPLDLDHGRPT